MVFLQLLDPGPTSVAYLDDPDATAVVRLLIAKPALRVPVFRILENSGAAVFAVGNGIQEFDGAKDTLDWLRALGEDGAGAISLLEDVYRPSREKQRAAERADGIRGEILAQMWFRVAASVVGGFPNSAREGRYIVGSRTVPADGFGQLDVLATGETGAVTIEAKASVRNSNRRDRTQIRNQLREAREVEQLLSFTPLWFLASYQRSDEMRDYLDQARVRVPRRRLLGRDRATHANRFIRRRCS